MYPSVNQLKNIVNFVKKLRKKLKKNDLDPNISIEIDQISNREGVVKFKFWKVTDIVKNGLPYVKPAFNYNKQFTFETIDKIIDESIIIDCMINDLKALKC